MEDYVELVLWKIGVDAEIKRSLENILRPDYSRHSLINCHFRSPQCQNWGHLASTVTLGTNNKRGQRPDCSMNKSSTWPKLLDLRVLH